MTDIIDKKTAKQLEKEQADKRKQAEALLKEAEGIEQKLAPYRDSSLVTLLDELHDLLTKRPLESKFDDATKEKSKSVNDLINPAPKKRKKKTASASKKQTKINEGMGSAILELLKANPDKKFKRGEIDEEVFEDSKVQTLNAVDWRGVQRQERR